MLHLTRHGETPHNVEGRFQGQNDVGLTALGVEQAHAVARLAAAQDFAGLYCSPLRRARQTAEVVGAAIGLAPQVDDRFKEADTGDWTERLFVDVQRDAPEAWAAYHATDPGFRFPGGESLQEQMRRVLDALSSVADGGRLPALIVCHRGVVRAARSHTHIDGLRSYMSWDVPNGSLEAL